MNSLLAKNWPVLFVAAIFVIVIVGVVLFLALKKKSTAGSAIYLPGENIASPLETYDQWNPEYATVSGMTRKRTLNEINARHSQQVKYQHPEVFTELDKYTIVPEATDKQVADAKARDQPAPAAPSPMLKAYLSGPLETEARNVDVLPMYEVYRM